VLSDQSSEVVVVANESISISELDEIPLPPAHEIPVLPAQHLEQDMKQPLYNHQQRVQIQHIQQYQQQKQHPNQHEQQQQKQQGVWMLVKEGYSSMDYSSSSLWQNTFNWKAFTYKNKGKIVIS
jgi:hypothetical protein